MVDVILAASKGYGWPRLEPWIKSLRMAGYKDDVIIILYDDDHDIEERMAEYGVEVIKVPAPASIFNGRFLDFYRTLSARKYRFAIATDIKDVFFQSNPIFWLETNLHKPFLACSESMNYRDEPWGFQNIRDGFPHLAEIALDSCIYNVGIVAGNASYIADLCLAINLTAESARFPKADQSGYNILLHLEPYKSVVQHVPSEGGFACQAGTTADPSKIFSFRPFLLEPEPQLSSDGIVTSTGLIFPIVHQYDRVAAWSQFLLERLARQ